MSTAAADPLLFNNAVATVVEDSMAKRSQSGLQLHRLVQAAVRTRHTQLAGGSHDLHGPAATAMSEPATSPVPQQRPLRAALAVLRAAAPADTSALQHHHRNRVRAEHPDVGAVLNTLALILRELGDFAAARPLAERALAIAETPYGPEHPDVGVRLSNLAGILEELGDVAAARPLAEPVAGRNPAPQPALGPNPGQAARRRRRDQ